MHLASKRGHRAARAILPCALLALALTAPSARAAGPAIGPAWATDVSAASARLHAQLDPQGQPATYHFDYLANSAYEANLAAAKEGFTGALRSPAGADAAAGSSPTSVTQLLTGLKADTAYRYRVVAKNSAGTEAGSADSLTTFPLAGPLLADGRGWELISPPDKNGGQVEPGAVQAAAQGSAIAYASASAFGGAQGAPPLSQYLATRTASGWSSENLTTPILSGSYAPGTAPYRLFSTDLAAALLLNGEHCRGEGEGCPVANPPLPGSGGPVGFQDYYLRDSASGGFQALLTAPDLVGQDPAHFSVELAGASGDLRHVVLSSCVALTPDASEVGLGEGCDPKAQNLYLWSAGQGLSLLNGAPGTLLASPAGAISTDGSHVYFTYAGNLYLREGNVTKQADADAGGGGSFEAASGNGSLAYLTKAGHLWRYAASSDSATDLTPAGGVAGVLGAAVDGSHIYYQDASGLRLWQEGTTTTIAPGAGASQPTDSPPATGAARVSASGAQLLFSSTDPLSGYDNTDQRSGAADAELFLYDANESSLTCLSCNPTGERPLGPSSLPGAEGYLPKPRALSADGHRVFFDSEDALVLSDTNSRPDVYQWEASGEGSCTRSGGCISLISSGKATEGASFADASTDGADAYFLTDASLVGADTGSLDLYDARVGGGFAESPPPIPCEGDACQVLPAEPVDPTLTTLLSGLGNPKVHYVQRQGVRGKGHHKGKGHRKGHKQKHGGRR